MNAVNEYRAKGFECLSLAECMNDPGERAEMLRFARIWVNLAKPVEEVRGAYELPRLSSSGKFRLGWALSDKR
jgi:hypothetical protein